MSSHHEFEGIGINSIVLNKINKMVLTVFGVEIYKDKF